MNKWKEELRKACEWYDNENLPAVEEFIETEIIEKLIKEIPAHVWADDGHQSLQQQLRAKWLNN